MNDLRKAWYVAVPNIFNSAGATVNAISFMAEMWKATPPLINVPNKPEKIFFIKVDSFDLRVDNGSHNILASEKERPKSESDGDA